MMLQFWKREIEYGRKLLDEVRHQQTTQERKERTSGWGVCRRADARLALSRRRRWGHRVAPPATVKGSDSNNCRNEGGSRASNGSKLRHEDESFSL